MPEHRGNGGIVPLDNNLMILLWLLVRNNMGLLRDDDILLLVSPTMLGDGCFLLVKVVWKERERERWG